MYLPQNLLLGKASLSFTYALPRYPIRLTPRWGSLHCLIVVQAVSVEDNLSVAVGYPIPALPIEFKVKVVEVSNSLRVAIPKEILRAVGVQQGDTLIMTQMH